MYTLYKCYGKKRLPAAGGKAGGKYPTQLRTRSGAHTTKHLMRKQGQLFNAPPPARQRAPSQIFALVLTHQGDDDGLGGHVALDVAGLARVAARLAAGHLLQHQALVGDDHPVRLVIEHLLSLMKKKKHSIKHLRIRQPSNAADNFLLQSGLHCSSRSGGGPSIDS